ncbi:DUF4829 domain-containing protein [Actinomadura alba]|uniref:DUF4829 domain-containing protein n=1 Tax=Actinomadura alba TaxID=406431 RepID=A0ABR7LHL7_9ACTN|nr:DUF4829 domain-containing protein [Actinomadura alba]MBC6463903.1 DUF4829 domain-containing protein [Actinomadura alba]
MKPAGRGIRTPLLALLAGATLVSACGNDPKSRVSIPPDNASPQDVVSAYVEAINAHDSAAGRALSTSHFADQLDGMQDNPFKNVIEISKLRVEAPIPNGNESPDGKRYHSAVYVPVKFTLKQREVVSMPDGDTTWGYVLVRAGADEPWRINDNGTG